MKTFILLVWLINSNSAPPLTAPTRAGSFASYAACAAALKAWRAKTHPLPPDPMRLASDGVCIPGDNL